MAPSRQATILNLLVAARDWIPRTVLLAASSMNQSTLTNILNELEARIEYNKPRGTLKLVPQALQSEQEKRATANDLIPAHTALANVCFTNWDPSSKPSSIEEEEQAKYCLRWGVSHGAAAGLKMEAWMKMGRHWSWLSGKAALEPSRDVVIDELVSLGADGERVGKILKTWSTADGGVLSWAHGLRSYAKDLVEGELDELFAGSLWSTPGELNTALRTRLEGHRRRVESLMFLPDGRLVSASGDKTVHVWSCGSNRSVEEVLTGHTGPVTALGLVKDHGAVVSGSEDGSLTLWYLADGWSPLVLESGGSDPPPSITAITVLRNSRIIVGSENGSLSVWSYAEASKSWSRAALTGESHDQSVTALSARDSGGFVSSSLDKKVVTWTKDLVRDEVHTVSASVTSLLCVQGSETQGEEEALVVGLANGTIEQVAVDGWSHRRGHKGAVNALIQSQESCSIFFSAGADGLVHGWNRIDGTLNITLYGHPSGVHALAAHGRLLASGGSHSSLILWVPANANPEYVSPAGHTGAARALLVLRDGHILTGGDDRKVIVWAALEEGALPRVETQLEGHAGPVTCLSQVRGGIASGSLDGTIRIWSRGLWTTKWDTLKVLSDHAGGVEGLACLTDGQTLVSRSLSTVCVWDSQAGTKTRTFDQGATSMAILDGSSFIVGDWSSMIMFDAHTGAAVSSTSAPAGWVTSMSLVTWNGTNRQVLVGCKGRDNSVHLWVPVGDSVKDSNALDMAPGLEILCEVGQPGQVLVYDPSSSSLTIWKWVGKTPRMISTLCVVLSRPSAVSWDGSRSRIVVLDAFGGLTSYVLFHPDVDSKGFRRTRINPH